MATLLLNLVGPMQSWGTRSRFDHRDTELEPSKSGVVGMLAAALGRSRDESVEDLATLRMGVRVDREGTIARDYHTAENVLKADQSGRQPTAVSERFYLADAAFTVGLEHGDQAWLQLLHAALCAPHWPLCLGRRAFVPSQPVVRSITDALRHEPLERALEFRHSAEASERFAEHRRLIIESVEETPYQRLDQPVGNFRDRAFAPRYLRMEVSNVSVTAAA